MENIILNDDCFNVFSKIPNKSVQLVCVDLPYGQTACSWDSIIDLDKMWVELKRIGKYNCQFVFFCTTKFGYNLIKSNEKWFRQDIVWEKTSPVGHLTSKKLLMKKHEMIYLFHNPTKPKDLKWIYNPQMRKGLPCFRNQDCEYDNGKVYGNNHKRVSHINLTGDKYPHTIVKIGNTSFRTNNVHPTQKPVDLCEWLIKTYSNENDLVLDFTMGSGSTVVACINTKRKYIGIEKDKTIFETAKKRIEELN